MSCAKFATATTSTCGASQQWSVWVALGLIALWESLAAVIGHETQKSLDRLVDGPVLMVLRADSLHRDRPARREPERVRRGQTDTRFRDRPAQLRRALRHPRHRRRQRPLSALVRAGGRGRTERRVGRHHLVPRPRLVRGRADARPVYPYDAAGPAVYRGRVSTEPTRPPLAMTIAQSRLVPEVVPLPSSVVFRKPGTNLVSRSIPRELPLAGLSRSAVRVAPHRRQLGSPRVLQRNRRTVRQRVGPGRPSADSGARPQSRRRRPSRDA